MLSTVAGIIVGYLIFAVPAFLLFRLTHHDPHAPANLGFEVFSVVYGVLFALLGGYVGTVISRKLWVGLTISAIMAAGAVTSVVSTGFSWSPIAALIFMVPAAVVGGWLRLGRQ